MDARGGSASAEGKAIARGLFAAAATVLAILLAPAGASATHLTGTGTGGATVSWGFNEDWGWSNGDFEGSGLANTHVQKAGAIMPDSLSANRLHVQWAYVEDVQGTYDWSISDAVYAAMQQHTAKPVMLLHRAPEWARDPAATCPFGAEEVCAYPPAPEFDNEWKSFVQAAVARYPNVRAIEIWNEPNLGVFWAPEADPSRYAAVLEAAHEGVLAAGSGAPVLLGGLFPANNAGTDGPNVKGSEFLDQVYTVAGPGAFEGIGSHPYTGQAPYVENMWSRVDALRGVRDGHGDGGTPLWITEMGISTAAAGGVPLDQQGDVLIQLYRSIEDHDVRSFAVHRLYDVGSGDGGEFGVLFQDLTPKPAYGELGAAIGTASPAPTPSPPPPTVASALSKRLCRGEGATAAGRRATDGNDVINGTPGDDVLAGLGGKDVVRGRGGDDLICGGAGKDRLIGGPGNDKLFGEGGKDTLRGGAGKDVQSQ